MQCYMCPACMCCTCVLLLLQLGVSPTDQWLRGVCGSAVQYGHEGVLGMCGMAAGLFL
jgi:hypothetical protein